MVSRRCWTMPAGGGDIAGLRLEEYDKVQGPGFGEIGVSVRCVGINFADVFTVLGLYSPIASGEIKGKVCPCLEFAGVVERVGVKGDQREKDSVDGRDQVRRGGQLVILGPSVWKQAETDSAKFAVGDRVMGCLRFGACASYVNVPAHQIRKIPQGWKFSQGAAFVAQTLTSYYALKQLGGLLRGQVVLIHSAAGGCGLRAIEICLKAGARIIGTVGSSLKVPFLLETFPEICSEQIIVRKTGKEFSQQLQAALAFLNEPYLDIVLDSLLGEFFHPAFKQLGPGGRHIVFGAGDMTPSNDKLGVLEWIKLAWQWLWRPKLDLLELPALNKTVVGFNLIHCLNDASRLTKLMDEVEALHLSPPVVGTELSFERFPEALRRIQSGNTTGKVVLAID